MTLSNWSLLVCWIIAFGVQCVAQSLPPPIPAGALGDLHTKFVEEYTAKMKALEDTHPLYVEVLGSTSIPLARIIHEGTARGSCERRIAAKMLLAA